MFKKQFGLSLLVLTCGLTGCVAAPLAQMAVSQMATPCPTGNGCQPGGVVTNISKGLGDSIHKLTSLASDSQTTPQ